MNELPLRNPADFPQQDRFGKSDNPAGQRGNCYQTCLSIMLNLPLREVPHFYDTDEEFDVQRRNIRRWLATRGWVGVWTPWEWLGQDWVDVSPESLVIMSGKSPRGEWHHVVIGRIVDNDWHLVHDPHPDGTGLDGNPDGFYIIAPLPKLSQGEYRGCT